MLGFLKDQKRRLMLTIGIALTFFAAELAGTSRNTRVSHFSSNLIS